MKLRHSALVCEPKGAWTFQSALRVWPYAVNRGQECPRSFKSRIRPKTDFRCWLLLLGLLLILPAYPTELATFLWKEDGAKGPLNIYWDEHSLRVETPSRQFVYIADTTTEDYTGLEIRDAKYWQFSWPKLQQSLAKSRKNAEFLQNSSLDDPHPAPSPPPEIYEWKESRSRKTIGELHCQLWETKDQSQRRIALWCTVDHPAPSLELWKNYAVAQSRLRLVAVRSIGPDLPPEALAALPKEAGSPAELIVGEDEESSSMILQEHRTIASNPALFRAPPKYELDPLKALEGLE